MIKGREGGTGRGFYPQFMSIVTRGHLRRREERGRSLRWSLRSVELVTSETIELIHRKGEGGGREGGSECNYMYMYM